MSTIDWIEKGNGLLVDYTGVLGKTFFKYTKVQSWYKHYVEETYVLPPPEMVGFIRFRHTLIDSYYLMRLLDELDLTDDYGFYGHNIRLTVEVPKWHSFSPMIITGIDNRKLSPQYLMAVRGRTKKEQLDDADRTVQLYPEGGD